MTLVRSFPLFGRKGQALSEVVSSVLERGGSGIIFGFCVRQ